LHARVHQVATYTGDESNGRRQVCRRHLTRAPSALILSGRGIFVKLRDILVVETGPGFAGPLVPRTLGDFGARLIKIESATKVDIDKGRIPPPGKTAEDARESPGVMEMSGGKQSITLNLKTEEGRVIFLALLDRADVYVESYAPGWLERLGLSIEQFTTRNPRLIVLSESGFGSDGPKRDQRAYAPLMTAAAGVESTVGYADGRIVPQIASAVGDLVAAYFGVLLVISALHERERTGKGAIIDLSQTEVSAAMAGIAMAEYGLSGDVPQPMGNRDPRTAPHGVYPCAGEDSWVSLAVWNDAEWQTLSDALNLDEADRNRFARVAARLAGVEELDALLASRTCLEKRDELFHRLQAAGISCTPVLDIYEADDFPAHVERGLWTEFQHPRLGKLRLTETPWRYDATDLRRQGWAEQIGASTDSVLEEFMGATPDQIQAWRDAGVLV
jgi:crotonobetainyl-CoA:carnitine CoA-transferase CaiB-like acyl-CoA transferase